MRRSYSMSSSCVTTVLHKDMETESGVTLDFRLDGKFFNIRKLQAAIKIKANKYLSSSLRMIALLWHIPQKLYKTHSEQL